MLKLSVGIWGNPLFFSRTDVLRFFSPCKIQEFNFIYERFLKSPEISHNTDKETIAQIRNALNINNNLCNHLLKSASSNDLVL